MQVTTFLLLLAGVIVASIPAAFLFRRFRGPGGDWSAHGVREVELQATESEVVRLVERTLGDLGASVRSRRHAEGEPIEAFAGTGRGASGFRVEVALHSLGPALFRLEISCAPITPRLFDYGQSRSIVDRIASDLLATRA